jgi:hypothetical protein
MHLKELPAWLPAACLQPACSLPAAGWLMRSPAAPLRSCSQSAPRPDYLAKRSRITLWKNVSDANYVLVSLLPPEELQHFNVPELEKLVRKKADLQKFYLR